MNRFQKKEKSVLSNIWLLSTYTFLIIFFITFTIGMQNATKNSYEEQTKHLKNVITKDIIQCYTLEGTYPPDLSYLEEHYGLHYDKKMFYVDYISIGSNIFPDISVITLK